MHVISQNIDGGATEADGGASAPVGPSVATPLTINSEIAISTMKSQPLSVASAMFQAKII